MYSLLVGTTNGIMFFDKEKNEIVEASSKVKSLSKFKSISITNISESENGILWAATRTNGLFSANLESGRIKEYKTTNYDNTKIKNNLIHAQELNSNGNIWVGTHQGLSLLRKNENNQRQ